MRFLCTNSVALLKCLVCAVLKSGLSNTNFPKLDEARALTSFSDYARDIVAWFTIEIPNIDVPKSDETLRHSAAFG